MVLTDSEVLHVLPVVVIQGQAHFSGDTSLISFQDGYLFHILLGLKLMIRGGRDLGVGG